MMRRFSVLSNFIPCPTCSDLAREHPPGCQPLTATTMGSVQRRAFLLIGLLLAARVAGMPLPGRMPLPPGAVGPAGGSQSSAGAPPPPPPPPPPPSSTGDILRIDGAKSDSSDSEESDDEETLKLKKQLEELKRIKKAKKLQGEAKDTEMEVEVPEAINSDDEWEKILQLSPGELARDREQAKARQDKYAADISKLMSQGAFQDPKDRSEIAALFPSAVVETASSAASTAVPGSVVLLISMFCSVAFARNSSVILRVSCDRATAP